MKKKDRILARYYGYALYKNGVLEHRDLIFRRSVTGKPEKALNMPSCDKPSDVDALKILKSTSTGHILLEAPPSKRAPLHFR